MGHDVTMVSQYRGDEEGTRVYGGGPPPEVPGVRVIGLEALGEQDGGDFERDVEMMAGVVVEEHEQEPFDVIHAQYGYPTGLAALVASHRTGVPNLVSIQGGDGHWVGSCCGTHKRAMIAVLGHAGAVLIGCPLLRRRSYREPRHPTGPLHHNPRRRRNRTLRIKPRQEPRLPLGPAGTALPRPGGPPQRRPGPARRLRHPTKKDAAKARNLRHRPGLRRGSRADGKS